MMSFMIETPRWLVLKGKEEQALRNLTWLRQLPADHEYIQHEMAEYRAQLEHEMHITNGIGLGAIMREAFSPQIRSRIIIGCGIQLAQNTTGINVRTINLSIHLSLFLLNPPLGHQLLQPEHLRGHRFLRHVCRIASDRRVRDRKDGFRDLLVHGPCRPVWTSSVASRWFGRMHPIALLPRRLFEYHTLLLWVGHGWPSEQSRHSYDLRLRKPLTFVRCPVTLSSSRPSSMPSLGTSRGSYARRYSQHECGLSVSYSRPAGNGSVSSSSFTPHHT